MNDYIIKTRCGIPDYKYNFKINPSIQESKIWYDIGNEDSEGYQYSCWYEITVIYLYYFFNVSLETIIKNSSHENHLLFIEFIKNRRFYKNIDSVIDVGSHQGFFSLGLSSISKKLICIEPFIENFKYLKENIGINNLTNVECINAFVSSKSEKNMNFDLSSLYRFNNTNIYEFEVNAICLDDLFDEIEYNSFIKIDAEGEEMQILKGCKKLILEKNPNFSIELHSFCKDDHNELKTLIDFNKYDVLIMKRNNAQLYLYTDDVEFKDINYIFFRNKIKI